MVVGLEVENQDPTWLLPTCSYLSPYKKVGWFDKNKLYMCKYVIGTYGECPGKDQECRFTSCCLCQVKMPGTLFPQIRQNESLR